MLAETSGAGAPFPHCGAAHGASGGPRLPPERVTRVPRGAQLGRAWCFSPSLASLCYSLRLAKAVYGNYTHGAYTLRYTGHRVHPYGFTGTEYRVY